MKNSKIDVIAFDADDTLWVNEPHYQACEENFCDILSEFAPEVEIRKELIKTDIANVDLYGYGAKGFMLSMIETAIRITNSKVPNEVISKIIAMGHELLNQPVELLEGVKETLKALKPFYRLVLATKGDLLDQQRKLMKSGLEEYFSHIEIMSNKEIDNYVQLLINVNVSPERFVMVGNSVKSDILPVIKIGAWAVHIPYSVTWEHEKVEIIENHKKIHIINNLTELIYLLR